MPHFTGPIVHYSTVLSDLFIPISIVPYSTVLIMLHFTLLSDTYSTLLRALYYDFFHRALFLFLFFFIDPIAKFCYP